MTFSSARVSLCCGVAALISAVSSLGLTQGLQLPKTSTKTCDILDFASTLGHCKEQSCELAGGAQIMCEDLTLWADHIDLKWDKESGQFVGAEARGHVGLVEGGTLIRCDTMRLGPDRIQAQINAAEIVIKKPGFRRDAQGMPTGKHKAIFHGNITRHDTRHITVREADFTVCDCGEGRPSWLLYSPEIDVTVNERATVWWPQFHINAFGLGLVPITPPLAPLSIPLTRRAVGALPPLITFLGDTPTLDIPVFIPFGRSWDLTLTPGTRTDWIENNSLTPSRWGAPRLGTRVRYHPTARLKGELSGQWTWDRKHFRPRQYARDLGLPQESWKDDDTYQRLDELEHRISLHWEQDYKPHGQVRWLIDANWISDDRYPTDFGVGLTEQVVNYVPSRTQLAWRGEQQHARIAADYLLRVENVSEQSFRNTAASELLPPNRGPTIRWQTLPLSPGFLRATGFAIDAGLESARYGPWSDLAPPTLSFGAGHTTLAYRHAFGPVNFFAASALHGRAARDGINDETAAALFAHGLADVSATAAGRLGSWLHTLTPRLSYRGIPGFLAQQQHSLRDGGYVWPVHWAHIEPTLDVQPLQQVAFSFEQSLWDNKRKRLGLDLRFPVDLARQALAPLRAQLSWSLPVVGSGNAWAAYSVHAEDEPFQELGANSRHRFGPLSLGFRYQRLAPNAERFARNNYALVALADAAISGAFWSHQIGGDIGLSALGFNASYSLTRALELPGPQDNRERPYNAAHVASIRYTSPCDCWGIGTSLYLRGPGDFDTMMENKQILFTFSVGDYALDNRAR